MSLHSNAQIIYVKNPNNLAIRCKITQNKVQHQINWLRFVNQFHKFSNKIAMIKYFILLFKANVHYFMKMILKYISVTTFKEI